MNALETTNHSRQRMAQRGLGATDIDVILQYATEVPDGYVMRNKDCQKAVSELNRQIEMVRRLSGKRLVVIDGALVTVYQADDHKVRQLLRTGAPRRITRTRRRGRGG